MPLCNVVKLACLAVWLQSTSILMGTGIVHKHTFITETPKSQCISDAYIISFPGKKIRSMWKLLQITIANMIDL